MLVSRILRALLDDSEPHEILAITFTRKAAGEMRVRLYEWLSAYAAPRSSDEERAIELRARGLGEAEAHALAPAFGRLYERVLSSGRRVEIRTFHAWFAQLLRAAPLELLAPLGCMPTWRCSTTWPSTANAFSAGSMPPCWTTPMLNADYHALVRDGVARRCASGSMQRGTSGSRSSLPMRPARWRPACRRPAALWPEHAASDAPASDCVRMRLRISYATRSSPWRAKAASLPKQGGLLERALEIEDDLERFEQAHAALFTQKGEPRRGIEGADIGELLDLLAELRRACINRTRTRSTAAWCVSPACCCGKAPPTSAGAVSRTWPIWSVAHWRCCAMRRCRAGSRSDSINEPAMS
jgi:ATP-dependent helicase/nuclease subunit A